VACRRLAIRHGEFAWTPFNEAEFDGAPGSLSVL
jgi:hypothetical protein